MIKILLFLLISSFAFSGTYPSCSPGALNYWKLLSSSDDTRCKIKGIPGVPLLPYSYCGSYAFTTTYTQCNSDVDHTYHNSRTDNYEKARKPICPDGGIFSPEFDTCHTPCAIGATFNGSDCSCPEGEQDINGTCAVPPPEPECGQGSPDIDCDGVPNDSDPDIDGDGVPNDSDPDIDGDGLPNWNDPDIDGDGTANGDDSSPGGSGGDSNSQCKTGSVYDNQTEGCKCLNGTVYDPLQGCINSSCPIVLNGLDLKLQNVTQTVCYSTFPAYSGYIHDFFSDGYLSCCYAQEGLPPEEDCPTNQYRANDGMCKDIPSNSPECSENEFLEDGICKPIPCPDGQFRNGSGVCVENPNGQNCLEGYTWSTYLSKCVLSIGGGSGGDSNNTLPGSGGGDSGGGTGTGGYSPGDGDTIEEKIMLEFSEADVTAINNEFSSGIGEQFSDLLSRFTPDLTTLFLISIPLSPSCGCKNPVIDFKGITQIIEICNPLDKFLNIMRPILWFSMLIGLLFGFFRGGQN